MTVYLRVLNHQILFEYDLRFCRYVSLHDGVGKILDYQPLTIPTGFHKQSLRYRPSTKLTDLSNSLSISSSPLPKVTESLSSIPKLSISLAQLKSIPLHCEPNVPKYHHSTHRTFPEETIVD
ncbi:hypothetical protein TNIN_432201 [Trichonephila inaurata madagascariensis]|uniref:Uncharacterized protein n=1 Tax=Trichonephila inaurata madagascariensis TaxID=2747483 RepID=A0A8X6YDI1_9ARAC|nr:hypothetical protein TNIN_432201 [Trichonephila inaurata madagascariensis]